MSETVLPTGKIADEPGSEADPTDAVAIQELIPERFSSLTVGGRADWEIMPKRDGSFEGTFKLWDWGNNGPEYPNGTCEIVRISGIFSEIEKVSPYSYRMVADNIEAAMQAGETYISDNARYFAVEDTFYHNGDIFYLFLPGVPHSELPQGLIDSVNLRHSMAEITPNTYILYQPSQAGDSSVFIGELASPVGQNAVDSGMDRQLTTLTTYFDSGEIWYQHEFDWDENGRLLQVRSVEDPTYIRTMTFQYNEQGKILREELSANGNSYVRQENTYSSDGKKLTGRVATEDGYGYQEATYHYDSSGRLYKIILIDDYSRRETTCTDFDIQGNPIRREITDTVLSIGSQTHAIEHLEYDEQGREIAWSYSGSDRKYSMTYRYDIKPFVVCEDEKGRYTLVLENPDGTSCWTIDIGCNYTPLGNGVMDFQKMEADTGTLEIDPDGYLTRVSFMDGSSFEFAYD